MAAKGGAMKKLCLFVILCWGAMLPAAARPLKVVADIAPIQSLVAQVAGPVALLVPAVADPHDFSFRPSQARALQQADLVFWLGEPLTPWLAGPLANLAQNAEVVTLSDQAGTRVIKGPQGVDPHMWLDPENARLWLGIIAGTLARHDPQNAQTYWQNAQAAQDRIARLQGEIARRLQGFQGREFLAVHDFLRYFQNRFNLSGAAISTGESSPGAARLRQARRRLASGDVACLVVDPSTSPRLLATLVQGNGTRVAEVDVLGSRLASGPLLYENLLADIAARIQACLQ